MKRVILLRHAKSSWRHAELTDIERPLSKRGRHSATALGRYLAAAEYRPAQILCSSSERTRETLARLQEHFAQTVPTRYEKGIYMADAASLLRRLRRLTDRLASVMIIGHNPGLEQLALLLIGSSDAPLGRRLAEKFPPGAIAVIAADVERWTDLAPGGGRLEAFIRPKDLLEADPMAGVEAPFPKR
jgi:phosphohistidine phosphatase